MYISKQRTPAKTSKISLRLCGLLALSVMLSLLTGCGSVSSKNARILNVYQPSVLGLEAGVPIQAKEGIYTPQTDETWHSDKRFRELERKLINE
jgi:hypothetical protein